jgi:hypothetical protein
VSSQVQALANDTSYSSASTPGAKNPFYYSLQSELFAINKELSERNAVLKYEQKFGEDATRFKFGDSATDRALRDMQDAATRTSNSVAELNQRLANSGLFPLHG